MAAWACNEQTSLNIAASETRFLSILVHFLLGLSLEMWREVTPRCFEIKYRLSNLATILRRDSDLIHYTSKNHPYYYCDIWKLTSSYTFSHDYNGFSK